MDHKAIADELKRIAQANPWDPFKHFGPPPKRHHRSLEDGLHICFTLDILDKGEKFWHLSLNRRPGGLSRDEQELWCKLFFDEPPTIERPSEIPGLGVGARHFFWKANLKEGGGSNES